MSGTIRKNKLKPQTKGFYEIWIHWIWNHESRKFGPHPELMGFNF
jgi:hypothetical protein